ncbi:MAG: beta-lactamase family protein [Opitutales bacterium]|nr:beta-lactamase family protein [Opitutales bacterium]
MSPNFVTKCWLLAGCLCLLTWSAIHAEQAFRQGYGLAGEIDRLVPDLMEKWQIPGISIALIESGEIAWTGSYGIKQTGNPAPVSEDTVFEAASMSKPFFAYLVMQLVEAGLLELDRPLVEYYEADYMDDPRHRKMTARMVLSHKGGFPNWRPGGRRGGQPLPLLFEPGSDYTYSGEGYWYLQRVVEKLTGSTLETLSQQKLKIPLSMLNSSFVWQDSFATQAAGGHSADDAKPILPRRIYENGNAAFTLYTTGSDYARFIVEMMKHDRSRGGLLSPEGRDLMLQPETQVKNRDPIARSDQEGQGEVYFGLGWRIDKVAGALHFCHSGSNRTGFRCYSEFNPETQRGIVVLTNSAGGHRLWQTLIREIGPL